jgi:hypothetical protein
LQETTYHNFTSKLPFLLQSFKTIHDPFLEPRSFAMLAGTAQVLHRYCTGTAPSRFTLVPTHQITMAWVV